MVSEHVKYLVLVLLVGVFGCHSTIQNKDIERTDSGAGGVEKDRTEQGGEDINAIDSNRVGQEGGGAPTSGRGVNEQAGVTAINASSGATVAVSDRGAVEDASGSGGDNSDEGFVSDSGLDSRVEDIASDSGGEEALPVASCLDDIEDYASEGPFAFEKRTVERLLLWVPSFPAGCRVPMVNIAIGTGAMCLMYEPSLERLASHGFIALCYQGHSLSELDTGFQAFQTVLAEYPDQADLRFGSCGHQTGVEAALVSLHLAEQQWGDRGVYAGLYMQPDGGAGANPPPEWIARHENIRSPVFMYSGLVTDGLVPQAWVQQRFDAMFDTIEAYHWAKDGLQAFPVSNIEFQQVSIPWFRWKLLGDRKACEAFKAIRNDETWTEAAVQNEQPCD